MGAIIVDDETGEIMDYCDNYEFGDSLRLMKKTSVDKLRNSIKWRSGDRFIKIFSANLKDIEGKLSAGALGIMFSVIPCIQRYSNLLMADYDNDIELNRDSMIKLTGLSKNVIDGYLRELVKNRVLFQGLCGTSHQYYANPYLYCDGIEINKTLEAMFKGYPSRLKKEAMIEARSNKRIYWGNDWDFTKHFTDIRPMLTSDVSKKALGLLVSLFPYVSYSTNLLCRRGRSEEFLTNKDIQDITGLPKNTTNKYLAELVSSKALSRDKDGKHWKYYINPEICIKGARVNKDTLAKF